MYKELNTVMEVTQIAKDKIKQHLTSRGKGVGIRIGVETTGCSGFAYKLEFADNINDEDIQNRLRRVLCNLIDPKAQ